MKYQDLANTLSSRIDSKVYPVRSLLPTEHELCREFGVSRYTVREAIRKLKSLGLVSQRAGVGTRVEASAPPSRYVQSPESIEEMLKFSTETPLQIRALEMVVADRALAEELRCPVGQRWLLIDAVRILEGARAPFTWTRIYVNEAYAGVRKFIRRERGATYKLIEKHFDETVTDIYQEITATTINAKAGAILQAPLRSPALRVTRRYAGVKVDPMIVSLNIHPASRFTFSTQLQLNKNLEGLGARKKS